MSELILTENATDRSTPSSGKVTIYPKTDGLLYMRKDTGAISRITEWTENNTYRVSASDGYPDLYTIIAYLKTLTSHTDGVKIIVENGHYAMTDTLVVELPMFVFIECDKNVYFEAATGLINKNMFDIRSDCVFSGFIVDGDTLTGWKAGTNASFFYFSTEGVNCEILDFTANGAKKLFNVVADIGLFAFNFVATSCTTGVEVNSSGTSENCFIDFEVGNFEGCAKSIDLVKGTLIDVFFTAIRFKHFDSEVALTYDRANFTYKSFIVTNSYLNQLGTNISGIDFTNALDADIEFVGNLRTKDSKPNAKINVAGASATQNILANTWTKVGFVNSSSIATKFTITDNKKTYLSNHSRDLISFISCNVLTTTQPCTVDIGIVKNGDSGTIYGKMGNYLDANSKSFPVSTNAVIQNVTKNDYIEIWIRANAYETIIVQDVCWLTISL